MPTVVHTEKAEVDTEELTPATVVIDEQPDKYVPYKSDYKLAPVTCTEYSNVALSSVHCEGVPKVYPSYHYTHPVTHTSY